MSKEYFKIIKPGIIFGNLIAVLGGYLLASQGSYNFTLLFISMLGVGLVISSACIFNNYIDRDIDQLMSRTKNRYLVQNKVSFHWICLHIIITGVSGFLILYYYGNPLSAYLSVVGYIIYIFIYTIWLKRRSTISTIAGSFSGAIPPIIGYCCVTNNWDLCATLLFILFCLWQMPHHYAISIFRLKDYRSAKIPVLPAVVDSPKTFKITAVYIIGFSIISMALYWTGYTSHYYLIVTTIINLLWLYTAFSDEVTLVKARKTFIQSIIAITLNCLLMGT